MIRFFILVALIATNTFAIAAPPPNPFNDRLRAMDDITRNGVMRRAITDNGERCGRLERSVYTRAYTNLQMWTVRCVPGGEWGVFIGTDASAQIRACGELRQLGLPPCTKLPPAEPTKLRR